MNDLTAEFLASVAVQCRGNEAALALLDTEDGASFCVASERTIYETASNVASEHSDTLLAVMVIRRDGVMTNFPLEGQPLTDGTFCPAGCMDDMPHNYRPERLHANEDGELSCPKCWDVFGFVEAGEVVR
jgi:hypothetical protein